MSKDLITISIDDNGLTSSSFATSDIEELTDRNLFSIFDTVLHWQEKLSNIAYSRLTDYSNRQLKQIEDKDNVEQINTNFKILLDKFNKLEKEVKEQIDE